MNLTATGDAGRKTVELFLYLNRSTLRIINKISYLVIIKSKIKFKLMSTLFIIFIVASGVAILLLMVLGLKINAFISLIITSVYAGILAGMPVSREQHYFLMLTTADFGL